VAHVNLVAAQLACREGDQLFRRNRLGEVECGQALPQGFGIQDRRHGQAGQIIQV